MKLLFFVFLLFTQISFASGPKVLHNVAELVKSKVSHLKGLELQDLIKIQYQRMRLIDENGKWAIKNYERLNQKLLPYMKATDVDNFINEIVSANLKNDYLMYVLSTFATKDFSQIALAYETDGDDVLTHTLAYAIALDRLTLALRADHRLFAETIAYWKQMRKDLKLKKNLTLGYKIKLFSIETPINTMMKAHTKKKVRKNLLKNIVPINIYEAGLLDSVKKHKDNWKTAKILGKYNPSGRHARKIYGRKKNRTRFTKDMTGIELSLPYPRKWADLYSTWQMAFVTQHKHFPFAITKLIIPSVANYYDNPAAYIYNRGVSLYSSLHFSFMGKKDAGNSIVDEMNWNFPKLTKAWGKANLITAKEYDKNVKKLIKQKKRSKKTKKRK